MTQKPRQLLSEFVQEVRLTGSKYLVVEGPDDRRFLLQWIEQQDALRARRPHVVAVDSLDIDAGELLVVGLNEGARSRVIFVAMLADAETLDVVCIADRDCGQDLELFEGPTLYWTDYPAIESYGFEATVLDALNRLFLGERLPRGVELVETMSPMLRATFSVRVHHPDLTDPDFPKAITRSRGVVAFNLGPALEPAVRALMSDYDELDVAGDPREHVYGHDLCALLFALYPNELKNQAHVRDAEALEDQLRAAMLIAGDLTSAPLFARLRDWAA